MYTALTIQEKLKDLRVGRGLSLERLAEQTGISKSALGSYEADENKDISLYNLISLAKYYGVSTDYLLGLTENKKYHNVELAELHLNDQTIELLKNGEINTRLLCEMLEQEDFLQLLADIEIYVDGIASMQIQNLNTFVSMAKEKIVQKYKPDKNDPHIRTLDAANINEDSYFRSIVHNDIDGIIDNIKNNHRNDRISAPQTTLAQEIKENIDNATAIAGDRQRKMVAFLCGQLGIDYKKLTDDEFNIMVNVFKKSKHMANAGKGKKRGRKQGSK